MSGYSQNQPSELPLNNEWQNKRQIHFLKRFIAGTWPLIVASLIFGAIAYSWFTSGIAFRLLGSNLTAGERVASLKAYFQSYGLLAPFVYMLFVVVEVVVAPIPGLMLYAPGGLIFGPFWGGLFAIIGNTLGAGLASALGRRANSGLKHTRIGRLLETDPMDELSRQMVQRGGWLIFTLRLNPLTSTDMISYAAGFSGIRIVHTMTATGLGVAPMCFAQSWLSDNLFNRFPYLIYPLFACGVIYIAVVVVVVRRMLLRKHLVPQIHTSDAL